MIGFGIGIVIRAGASTGGMDIPPLILKKKFGLPVSVMLYAFDVTILILQMLFSDKEEILYGILLVMIYTVKSIWRLMRKLSMSWTAVPLCSMQRRDL